MTDNWNGEGYDAEVSSGGGLWLRLKKRGDKVRLRLCSSPCRYTETYTKDDGTEETKRKVSWLAIQKEVVNGQPSKRVVVFQNGPMVYGILRDLDADEAWGDPRLYDISVERTEESGKYYTVTPLPKPMGPISAEEQELLNTAAVDWPAICLKSRGETPGGTGPDDEDPFA